jgi:hypothetical protein
MPDYNYIYQRSIPREGYLEGLLDKAKTSIISPIIKIITDSMICENRSQIKVDTIVSAMGFNISHRPRWPYIALEDRNLADE